MTLSNQPLHMVNTRLKLAFAIPAFVCVNTVMAGTPVEPKSLQESPAPQPEPWVVTVGAPAWLAFVNGNIGINGNTNLEQDMNVHPNYAAIDFASTQVVDQVAQQLGTGQLSTNPLF
jgi:hypothetical protein